MASSQRTKQRKRDADQWELRLASGRWGMEEWCGVTVAHAEINQRAGEPNCGDVHSQRRAIPTTAQPSRSNGHWRRKGIESPSG